MGVMGTIRRGRPAGARRLPAARARRSRRAQLAAREPRASGRGRARSATRLPLPIGGLISDLSFEVVAARLDAVEEATDTLSCAIGRPFMVLSFLALSVIPSLKLTDRGLVDVDAWEIVPVHA